MFDEPKKDLNPHPAGVGGIAKKSELLSHHLYGVMSSKDDVKKNIEVICLVSCHLFSSAFPQIFLLNIPCKT